MESKVVWRDVNRETKRDLAEAVCHRLITGMHLDLEPGEVIGLALDDLLSWCNLSNEMRDEINQYEEREENGV